MEIAKIAISGNQAAVFMRNPITSGTIGATVSFEFDESWEGMTKTLVWRGSGVTKDDLQATGVIPSEVVAEPNSSLFVGVYGTKDGTATPTVWVNLGRIIPGADPSGDETTDPQLPVWAQLEQRVNDMEEGAPLIHTAKVGQTIVVEEVDENGKPTKWKAADHLDGAVQSVNGEKPDQAGNVEITIPKGVQTVNGAAPDEAGNVEITIPEAPQPNWNAKEGEPGNVLNRTHYTESGRVEVLAETTTPLVAGDLTPIVIPACPVSPGDTVIVNWNGTEYSCVGTDGAAVNMSGAAIFGNIGAMTGGVDTGEPFVIVLGEDEGAYYALVAATDGSTEATLSIYHDAETVHKLDNKYLNLDWLPVYKEEPVTIYEDTVHLGTSKLKNYDVPPFSIVVGKKYSVVWNDKVYEVTAKRQDASYQGNQVSCTYLGNISVAGLTFEGLVNEDTGEDFCIGSNSLTGFYIYGTVKDSDNTITVAEYALVPNKLPKEYLPNGVPYCADGGMTELPVAGEWTENDGFAVTAPIGLEIGKTYVVNWDGTEYEVVGQDAYATTGGQLPGVFLGDGANLGGANTGEPFMILEVSAEVAAQMGIYGMIGSVDGSLNIPFTIYKDGTEIRKLDERCMPESVESVIIRSSTEGSTKLFKLTVDDSGTITATEVT